MYHMEGQQGSKEAHWEGSTKKKQENDRWFATGFAGPGGFWHLKKARTPESRGGLRWELTSEAINKSWSGRVKGRALLVIRRVLVR
jgi:hypothetical protein